MNKSEQNVGEPAMTLQAITETMEHLGCGPEQLPELWQQATATGDMTAKQVNAWHSSIETLFRRCKTYPQHMKLVGVLCGLPNSPWYYTDWITEQAHSLLQQATHEQLLQALAHEQQQPGNQWQTSSHTVTRAGIGQLTGPVIAQLAWDDWMRVWTSEKPIYGPDDAPERHQHISNHIQQNLLEGDENTWTIFLGIVEPGNNIGDTAALAVAIEQKQRRA